MTLISTDLSLSYLVPKKMGFPKHCFAKPMSLLKCPSRVRSNLSMYLLQPELRCTRSSGEGHDHRKSFAFGFVFTSFTNLLNCSSLSFSQTIRTLPNSPTRYPFKP